MAITSPPWFARQPPAAVGEAWVCSGLVGWAWAAGVGQADLAARGQGPVGLARLLCQQPAALSRLEQPLVDLAVVEGAGGDQVVEVAGGLPQLAVAVADWGGGDPGEFLGQRRPSVAVSPGGAGGRKLRPGQRAGAGGRRSSWARAAPRESRPAGCRGRGRGPTGRGGRRRGGWVGRPHSRPGPANPHASKPCGPGVAEAGGGQVVVPATPTGADQRPRTLQAMGGGQRLDGVGAFGAVDVQNVEQVPGRKADVGLGATGPPGQDPGPVTGGVLDPVGHQAAQGVLGGLAAVGIPTRAAGPSRRLVAGNGLEAAPVGEGVVQGQHRDTAGGIAKGNVAQVQAGSAHGVRSAAGGRWRCRKLAALLRPQPAASARVRAVQGWPSGRGWA